VFAGDVNYPLLGTVSPAMYSYLTPKQAKIKKEDVGIEHPRLAGHMGAHVC
jgi:hypothetical protein